MATIAFIVQGTDHFSSLVDRAKNEGYSTVICAYATDRDISSVVNSLHAGDILTISSIHDLHVSFDDFLILWSRIEELGCSLRSFEEPWIGDTKLTQLSLIRAAERCRKEILKKIKRINDRRGRKPVLPDDIVMRGVALVKNNGNLADFAREQGVRYSTLYTSIQRVIRGAESTV